MAFRSLGIEFVAKGMSNFTRAIDRVNRSLKDYGRSQIEAKRTTLYNSREAERQARILKNQLERSYEGSIRAILRYSDQMVKLKTQMSHATRQIMEQYLQSNKYKQHVDDLIKTEKLREATLRQIGTLEGTNSAKRDKLIQQLDKQENELRRLTSIMKSEITLMGQSQEEQEELWKIAGKIVEISKEKRVTITDLVDGYGNYNNALEDHKIKLKDLVSAQANWSNTTKQFMDIGKSLTVVRAATGDVTAVLQMLGGVFRTLTGILGKALGVIGNVAIAIGKTLYNALKKIVSIPVNMIKGLFNTLTGSLQRVFEIIIGMNASRLLWGLGRKFVELGKTAYQAAEDFQFLTIRLEALMRRELIDAGYSSSEAIRMVTGEAKELTDWVTRLAVLSPIGAKEIADTMTLAMSYNFTSKEAQKLTESIIKFSTAMGLGDVEVRRIIENFGQMRQQQKITGQELRDLARGAFVPVTDILKRMGVNLEIISGIKMPSLAEINRTFVDLRDSGQLTFEEFKNIDSGLREMAVGSSISAAGLKNLYDRGIITDSLLKELGVSVEDLNTVMSDAHFEDMKDQLDDLIATGEVSLDEFFWAFTDIVEDDFSDALTNASNSMKVARDNAKDFIETMIGWRVITPILDVVSGKVSKALQSLMSEDVMVFFDNLGSALAVLTGGLFDFVDSLLEVSAYKNTIGNIGRVLGSLFGIIGSIGKDDTVWASTEAITNLTDALMAIGVGDIGSVLSGLDLLRTTILGIGDVDPAETWANIKTSLEMIFGPIWEDFFKPQLETLFNNIKTFIVDKWNNDIKPAFADFATDTLLPGLGKFITETIPKWAGIISEHVGPMADTLRTGLWTALDKLSSWAEENQPGGALDLAFGLIKSLAEFLGITKMPENPMANWMPDYGPKQGKFESSGLAQALKDISEAVESLIANSDLLQNNVITPLQNLAETEWGKGFDSMIRMFEALVNLGSGPGETVGNILGIIATILGFKTEGGGGAVWKIGGFIDTVITFLADLIALPLDLINAGLDALQRTIDIMSESSNITWEELPSVDFSGIQLFEDIERIFGSEKASGPLDSMNTWLEDFKTAETDIETAVNDFISQGGVRTAEISAIGNEGSYSQVPFEDMLGAMNSNFEEIYGDDIESPSAKIKSIEEKISEIGNEGSYKRVPFEDMADDIIDIFTDLDNVVISQSIVPDMLEKIVTYLAENAPRITAEFTKLAADITDELNVIDLKPSGEAMMQGLLDGMQLKFAEILTWWQFTALPELTAIMDILFDFGSPSKVFKEYGKLMMEGLLVGIKGKQKQVLNTMTTGMSDLRGVAGYVNNNNNSNVSNNYNTSMDNRNIIINMNQSAGNLSLDYDYVRAIT